ncbi:MAG TPA: hypothetical protein PKN32_12835 [Bacteroidales bacterium]|nr:hypothetical protein [Bacteroidales bacterium]
MKNLTIICSVFVIISVISCKNNETNINKDHDNDHIATDTVRVVNSLPPTDTVSIIKGNASQEETPKTVYELFGEIFTLNGKVKSMLVLHCPAEISNGYVVINTEYPYYDNSIEFYESGEIKTHDYYKSCGGGVWEIKEFDSLGNPVVKIFWGMYINSDGRTKYFKYDYKNRLISEITSMEGSNEIIECVRYYYDTINNKEIAKYYKYGELKSEVHTIYDTLNNSKIVKSFSNGKINSKVHEYYDENQYLISKASYKYAADTLKSEYNGFYSYEFDKYGNWTLLYENDDDNDNRMGVTVRRITYYE